MQGRPGSPGTVQANYRDGLGAGAPVALCVGRRSKVVKRNVDGAAGVLGTENNFK